MTPESANSGLSAQTRSNFQLDDSRLAEIKQSFEKLRERIDVERTKTKLAEDFKTNTLTSPEKKVDTTKDGCVMTCTSGDKDCATMIQACCDCMTACMKSGCTCCVMMNGTPVCCC